jgi:HTH-type transcriptional regulator / antitoxin HigA
MGESSFQPDWFSKPGDTLATLMVRRELTPRRLAEKLECDMETVRALLAGTARVDEDMAFRLSRCVGGTPSFWYKRQSGYEKALARAAHAVPNEKANYWLSKLPRTDILTCSRVERSARRADAIKLCLAYFGVTGPDEWEQRYTVFTNNIAFRTSESFKSTIGSLSVWLRQGEIQAASLRCGFWDPNLLLSSIGELRVLTKAKAPTYFVPRMQEICAAAGVAVVFARAPSKCRASGAARFILPEKAMIILSFRYLSDDHVWFTLFHEIGHLLLHGMATTFVDGELVSTTMKELEANDFAVNALIPRERREELFSLRPRTKDIIRFAISIGISPGIIVGQLQYAKLIGRNQFNFLKRRYQWEDVASAFS